MNYKKLGTDEEESLSNFASFIKFGFILLGLISIIIGLVLLANGNTAIAFDTIINGIVLIIAGIITAAIMVIFTKISLRLKAIEDLMSSNNTNEAQIEGKPSTQKVEPEAQSRQSLNGFKVGDKVSCSVGEGKIIAIIDDTYVRVNVGGFNYKKKASQDEITVIQ